MNLDFKKSFLDFEKNFLLYLHLFSYFREL